MISLIKGSLEIILLALWYDADIILETTIYCYHKKCCLQNTMFKYEMLHIGETGRSVHYHMREQRTCNIDNNTISLQACYFSEMNHKFFNIVLNFELKKKRKIKRQKCLRKELEFLQQKEDVCSKLTNTKISFYIFMGRYIKKLRHILLCSKKTEWPQRTGWLLARGNSSENI